MYLDNLSEQEVMELNIPTGVPLVYELDDSLKPIRSYYLGDQARIEQAMQSRGQSGKNCPLAMNSIQPFQKRTPPCLGCNSEGAPDNAFAVRG